MWHLAVIFGTAPRSGVSIACRAARPACRVPGDGLFELQNSKQAAAHCSGVGQLSLSFGAEC